MNNLVAMTALVATLAMAGCSTATTKSPEGSLNKQLSDVQAENASLKEHVKNLEKEWDELQKQVQDNSSPTPSQTKIGREKAVEIALGTALNSEVSNLRLVEFQLNRPNRWVAVYVLDLVSKAEKRPAGSMVLDAVTGQVLSVSSPPSGQ